MTKYGFLVKTEYIFIKVSFHQFVQFYKSSGGCAKVLELSSRCDDNLIFSGIFLVFFTLSPPNKTLQLH